MSMTECGEVSSMYGTLCRAVWLAVQDGYGEPDFHALVKLYFNLLQQPGGQQVLLEAAAALAGAERGGAQLTSETHGRSGK
jgi:hypothetical protein